MIGASPKTNRPSHGVMRYLLDKKHTVYPINPNCAGDTIHGQMVLADIAGVAFSANPVNKNRDEVVINTNWGLGESVVCGTVSPDTYVVSKSDLQVLEREIAEKEKMTVAHPAEGTREVDVPRFMRGESTLDDAKVIEIAQLARVLEEQMGWPVDIECAYHGETLYLLQCRPITTLD